MNVYFSYLIDCVLQMEVKEEKSLFPDDYLRFWITVYYERELLI